MMQEIELAEASLCCYKMPTYSLISTTGIQADSRVARGSLSLNEMIALKVLSEWLRALISPLYYSIKFNRGISRFRCITYCGGPAREPNFWAFGVYMLAFMKSKIPESLSASWQIGIFETNKILEDATYDPCTR